MCDHKSTDTFEMNGSETKRPDDDTGIRKGLQRDSSPLTSTKLVSAQQQKPNQPQDGFLSSGSVSAFSGRSQVGTQFDDDSADAVRQGTITQSLVIVNPRIPYNNGYGDFCFGKMNYIKKWSIDNSMSEQEKLDFAGITGSFGIPIPELNGFQRSEGRFSFFKLPFEIRQRILRFLVAPLSKFGHLKMNISTNPYPQEDIRLPAYLAGDLRKYVNHMHQKAYYEFYNGTTGLRMLDRSSLFGDVLIAPEKLEEEEEKFRKEKEAYMHKEKRHPGRPGAYNVFFEGPDREGSSKGENTDWLFLRMVQQASNVSNAFRQELGDVVWVGAEITAEEVSSESICLDAFLFERPAIVKHIKKMELNLDWFRDSVKGGEKNFAWMVQMTNLKELLLDLTVTENDLETLVRAEGKFAVVVAFSRKLPAVKKFDLQLFVSLSTESDERLDDHEQDVYRDKLMGEYTPLLRETMMPDRLRFQPPSTEIEKYLSSRC